MACNPYRCTLAIGISGLAAIVFVAILGWVVVPIIVRNKIADILPLKRDTESWKRWENPPVPIYFSVYLFHVNNPDEILKGAMPNVTEKGPYVYRERREKDVLSTDEKKHSITYKQKVFFEFDEAASGNLSEDDVYTIPNLQALALSQAVNNLRALGSIIRFVNTALKKMWPASGSNPLFVKAKVKDFLFGQMPMYCNQGPSIGNFDVLALCNAVKLVQPRTVEIDGGGNGINTFSLFKYKNDTYDGIYEIDTGVDDVTQIGIIKTWNGVKKVNDWKGDSCNSIVGTDSTIFRPYLYADNVESLHIFNTDACRSLQLNRDGFAEYKGVTGIKYVTDESTFASVFENGDNYCYCPQSIKNLTSFGGCLKSGAIELSSCHRVPIIISHPHFLMADPSYQQIQGLKPDKTKHQSFLVLEPNTGYPLFGGSRIQINIFLQSIKEVDVMKELPNVLLPVVWMEESVQLTDELIGEMNTQLLNNLEIASIIRWTVFGIGLALTVYSVAYYYFKIRPTMKKEVAKKVESEISGHPVKY